MHKRDLAVLVVSCLCVFLSLQVRVQPQVCTGGMLSRR